MAFSQTLRPPQWLALVLVASTVGCGAGVRSAAREAPRIAVPVTIDETLKAGEDARTRARVAAILATPEVDRAVAEIARAAVAAGLDEASQGTSEERVERLAGVLGKVLAEQLVAGARASIAESLTPEHIKAAQASISAMVAAAVTAAMRAAGEELPATLGPAVRTSLARELRDPELRMAIDDLLDSGTRRVLLTSRQAITEAQNEPGTSGGETLLGKVRRFLTLSWALAFAFGAVLIGLLAWLVRMRLRTKRYRLAVIELMARTKRRDRVGDVPKSEAEEDDLGARTARLLEMLG